MGILFQFKLLRMSLTTVELNLDVGMEILNGIWHTEANKMQKASFTEFTRKHKLLWKPIQKDYTEQMQCGRRGWAGCNLEICPSKQFLYN